MIRGDTNNFSFKIKNGETYITTDDYNEIELQFNSQNLHANIRKLKSKGEIEYDSENQKFVCYLSQEDTFKLNDGNVEVQVRLFKEEGEKDYCKATLIKSINVGKVLSQEILKEE